MDKLRVENRKVKEAVQRAMVKAPVRRQRKSNTELSRVIDQALVGCDFLK